MAMTFQGENDGCAPSVHRQQCHEIRDEGEADLVTPNFHRTVQNDQAVHIECKYIDPGLYWKLVGAVETLRR